MNVISTLSVAENLKEIERLAQIDRSNLTRTFSYVLILFMRLRSSNATRPSNFLSRGVGEADRFSFI